MIPLKSKLHNDATVSDWLGTAALAARMASKHIEELRDETDTDPGTIQVALQYLREATAELETVQSHLVNHAHAR